MADPRIGLVPRSTSYRLLGIIPYFLGGANYPFLGEYTMVSRVYIP